MSNVSGLNFAGRYRERGYVCHKVVARIRAIEEVEELHKRPDAGALAQLEVAAYPQVHLCQRRSAKLIQRGLLAVDHSAVRGLAVAINVNAGSQRVRPSTLEL